MVRWEIEWESDSLCCVNASHNGRILWLAAVLQKFQGKPGVVHCWVKGSSTKQIAGPVCYCNMVGAGIFVPARIDMQLNHQTYFLAWRFLKDKSQNTIT